MAPISIYASIDETLSDTFNTGTNNELIPNAKPQVKNIRAKKAIGTKKLFFPFINQLCNTVDEYLTFAVKQKGLPKKKELACALLRFSTYSKEGGIQKCAPIKTQLNFVLL